MRIGPYTGDAAAWDAFVAADPAGSFCHLHGWRRVLSEGLRHDAALLCAEREGALEGLMPITRVAGPLGSFLVSVPFLSYGGPIGSVEAVRALARHAVERGRDEGVGLVELRCRARTWEHGGRGAGASPADSGGGREGTPGDAGAEAVEGRARSDPPAGMRVSDRRVAVLLPLPDDPGELWDGLRSKVRSQVRRPRKEGMHTCFGPDQLPPFYAVFTRNMRDLGTPVLPLRFFRAILDAFPAQARVGVVYHEGGPAAAGFGFLWRGELEMTWASSLRTLGRLAPNMLLYWDFMKHAVESGAHTFNFGRCPPGGGTHRFKLQWGGVDRALPWLQWPADGAAGTPSPAGGTYRLATRAWSRLPLPLANRLGPWIARTIP